MANNKYTIQHLHLLVSSVLVAIVALGYGLAPGITFPLLFDFKVVTTDMRHIFRALMCLYWGNIIIWVMGVAKQSYWRMATLVNIVFMSSLALGRFISLLVDGVPSTVLLIGLVVEIGLAIWGVINLKQYLSH